MIKNLALLVALLQLPTVGCASELGKDVDRCFASSYVCDWGERVACCMESITSVHSVSPRGCCFTLARAPGPTNACWCGRDCLFL